MGLVLARPGRHRDAHHRQRALASRAELEMRAGRDGYAGAWAQRNRFLPLGLTPPHLALPGQDVPDLIHGVVGHRPGDPARGQFEVAMEPRPRLSSTRTSEPSGATVSGASGSCMVSKSWSMDSMISSRAAFRD